MTIPSVTHAIAEVSAQEFAMTAQNYQMVGGGSRMSTAVVTVPGSLLLDRQLVGSAKLIWMILQLVARSDQAPASPRILEARSGLARHTVLQGLALLESTGCQPEGPTDGRKTPQGWASVPVDLLEDTRVGIRAKVLYAALQLTPEFRGATGQVTYAALSHLTGVSPYTERLAVTALQSRGWLQVSQSNKFTPIDFTLRNPVEDRHEREVTEAAQRLTESSFVGEALMREYLTLIVDSTEFSDNTSPGFLVNPYTSERLQFDRYYPPLVAFEYNGPQHYGPTERFPKEADAWKQEGRDCIKHGLCAKRGIRLVVVHAADLTLEGLRQSIAGLLPLRNLDDKGPLIAYLESASSAYRRKARENPNPK